MESALDYYSARALLDWQIELGATEAILDAPVNRYETPAEKPKIKAIARQADAPVPPAPEVVPVDEARASLQGVADLEGVRAALAAFEHCELKRGARKFVFADGNPAARVMIIGEAPSREDDREGKPFVGRAGQLLDRMFAAIDMGRDVALSKDAIYVTNVLPWRPPQNRDPQPEEIAMLRPFLERHIEIVAPDVIVVMGNLSCEAVLGRRGISRMRGNWQEGFGKPVLPMLHPEALLKQPFAKRDAWADLLSLKAKLESLS